MRSFGENQSIKGIFKCALCDLLEQNYIVGFTNIGKDTQILLCAEHIVVGGIEWKDIK